MRNEQETPIEVDLVPLALIAAEIEQSVGWVAHRFGTEVVIDDVGLRSVPAAEAREFFTQRASAKARAIEEQRRRTEEAAKRKGVIPAGFPAAKEGMSPVEAMVSQDPAFSTPKDDFGPGWGSPATELLDAELLKSQRELARRRAENAEKKRLRDQLKRDLR